MAPEKSIRSGGETTRNGVGPEKGANTVRDLLEAEQEIQTWNLDELKNRGVVLDRVEENPEAARYFLAYGDWHPVESREIFADFRPETARHTQIYVDFPFCPTVCNFCAFYGTLARNPQEVERYITNAQREVHLLAETYFKNGSRAESLELGGGTPTHVPLPLLRNLVDTILAEFPFRDGEPEHSFEATPESIAEGEGIRKLEYLRHRGFRRMSIGAQTFNDRILRASNRAHDSKSIERAFRNATDLSFDRINFDLLVGLADQDLDDFFQAIERTVDLGVPVIEIYAMRYFDTKKNVPLTTRLNQESRFLDRKQILLARVAADGYLRRAGYHSSNGRTYQKDGAEFYADFYKENFRGNNVLGIGRKAHSNVYPWQYANYRKIDKYNARLEAGQLPIAAGCLFDDRARLAKIVTGAFQLSDQFDFEAVRQVFPGVDASGFRNAFSLFEELGLLRIRDGHLEKTRLGFFFLEEMLKVIYEIAVTPFDVRTKFLGKSQRSTLPTQAAATARPKTPV